MAGEVAIAVTDVHKSFNRQFVRGGYTTLKTQLVQLFRRKGYNERIVKQQLHVLKGLNLQIRRGETVGIIGQNGAGKSTLLKLFTGIYRPTTGKVEHFGRVSALLELGAGFHPEFSGRENIYMNGMILGMSRKQLEAREADIIAFSELGDMIDAPVRTYSSGMYMRLAFSVAVHVEPDILVIDEILAVGDEHFQRKSQAKLDEFKMKNIAIVLVTHALPVVESWCTRAVWLHEGKVQMDGPPAEVTRAYREMVDSQDRATQVEKRNDLGEAHIDAAFKDDGSYTARVIVSVTVAAQPLTVKARIATDRGHVIYESSSPEVNTTTQLQLTVSAQALPVWEALHLTLTASNAAGEVHGERMHLLPVPPHPVNLAARAWNAAWTLEPQVGKTAGQG